MLKIRHKGNFSKTTKFLHHVLRFDYKTILNRYGKMGVEALAEATPRDTGRTAEAWKYDIEENSNGVSIVWSNENINDGVNIAVILQYGHGTNNGGYVAGRDYINPALQPVFDKMANTVWKELIRR
jgi:hypothetical protein